MTLCFNAKIKEISLVAFILLSIISCKKDTQSVGAEFVSRNQFETKFDTSIVLNAYSVKMDSVITSKLTSYALGSLYDPFLGISKATLITQVGLAGNGFSWEGATKLDSVVLQLRFRTATQTDGTSLPDYYGNKEAVHTFKVYLLDENISRDSVYYSTRNYKTTGIEMGSFTGKLNFTDSITIKLGNETVTIPPHIRINMNSTFNTLLYNGELNGAFLNDSKFKESIKGLVVVDETNVSSGEGAIVYLKLTSDVTALTAFYKDSMAADFPIFGGITGSESSYNYYEHINVPSQVLQTSFMGQHRDTGFVQPLTGCKLRIELPNLLTALSNPKIVLNGAEMVFTPLSGSYQSPYNLPASMSLLASDSLGRNAFLKDQIYETSTYYGGLLSNNQYRFNIVRHLQSLLDQNKLGSNYNYGLNLIIRADDPLTAERVILDTRKNSGSFKLKLTYTLIK